MRKIIFLLMMAVISLSLISCSMNEEESILSKEKPITVTVWHYYNGTTKEAFDALVSAFNDTVGMEKGIVVDAKSQGDVNQLAEAVFDAASQSIGSMPLPDIFASYPDNAFRVHEIVPLVPLSEYFSEDELAAYRLEFLEEGQFITDNKFYIMPIAKSSENLYVNKTAWETFSKEHNFTTDDLSTWEGIYNVAQTYYNESGKGFYGLDALANYIIVSSKQLNEPLYTYSEDGTAQFHISEKLGKKIWNYYYRPHIQGYYIKSGRFSSDDAKTGAVLSYTGSTAGAPYFPKNVVVDEDQTMHIEPLVLPYPYFENGDKVSIQQGAGMSITRSDKAHEYASALFLKWFTQTENNLRFAVSTGYYPSKNEALDGEKILEVAQLNDATQGAIIESIKASTVMFNEYKLYNNKPFKGSYKMRVLLDTFLLEKIQSDLILLEQRVESGENREAVIESMTSESAYNKWMEELSAEADKILRNVGNE